MEETVYNTEKHRIRMWECPTKYFFVKVHRHDDEYISSIYFSTDWAQACDKAISFIQLSIECEGCFIEDASNDGADVQYYTLSA